MAIIKFEVDNYRYSVYTQSDTGTIWDGQYIKIRGIIACTGDGYKTLIYSLDENSYLPQNRYKDNCKTFYIFGYEKQFEWYLDMLRNEKPVYFIGWTSKEFSPGSYKLTTAEEPVGEGEGD